MVQQKTIEIEDRWHCRADNGDRRGVVEPTAKPLLINLDREGLKELFG
jgi:hypothetical protein